MKCSNCRGDVQYTKQLGWGHIISTGCIKPAVSRNDWIKFLKEKNENTYNKQIDNLLWGFI